jgi:hypothetical protein
MNAGTLQQLVRIVMYSGGSMLLGQGIADGEMFQAVIGATGPIVAFIWWFFWERNRVSK